MKIIATFFFLGFFYTSFSQSIGIGTNSPDNSAKLEIKDSTKGILIPRMTMQNKNLISNPAEGLMIYQTDSIKGIWVYQNGKWTTNGLPSGTNYGDMLYWKDDSWVKLAIGNQGDLLVMCNGLPIWGGCKPLVSTTHPTAQTTSTFKTGGIVTNDGASELITKGVVWGTSHNPTIALQTKTTEGPNMGEFTSIISGLLENRTYYVRAYATNVNGTSYGLEDSIRFTRDITLTTSQALKQAQKNTATLISTSWSWLQCYLGYWARSGSYEPNVDEETYNITNSFQSQLWYQILDNIMDYQILQNNAKSTNATMYDGIARIMKTHDFALLVDLYDNVPYKNIIDKINSPTPSYDNGIDVYKDLLRQLDTAIFNIKSANTSPTGPNNSIINNDLMFGSIQYSGSTLASIKTKWIQFANTLKLRILTKCMNGGLELNTSGSVGTSATYAIDIATLHNEFAITTAEGSGFLTFDAQIQSSFINNEGNPFYTYYVQDANGNPSANSNYYKANIYAVGDRAANTSPVDGYYLYNADRRASSFYTTATGTYRGVAFGLPSDSLNYGSSLLSGIGVGVSRGFYQPAWIITAAESKFLQAECINRGFLSGDAQTTLENGITASFISLGQTATDATDYIAFNSGYADVDYTASEYPGAGGSGAIGGLYTIISQKWFALNAIAPFEVWSDYRRVDMSATKHHFQYGFSTGFDAGPAISVSPSNTKTEIPCRLLYPQCEFINNPTNAAAQSPPGDYPFMHVFWDLN